MTTIEWIQSEIRTLNSYLDDRESKLQECVNQGHEYREECAKLRQDIESLEKDLNKLGFKESS